MPFRYTLQTLLRLRESLEHQEEQRLFVAAAGVARLRSELQLFREAELQSQRGVQQELIAGSSGALLQFAELCRATASEVRKSLELRLEGAERKRLDQLHLYQAARQKREILQGLRQRQEAAYQYEFARQEQQAADEAFLIRAHSRAED